MEEEFKGSEIITLFDEDGEVNFQMLASHNTGGVDYLLVEEVVDEDEAGEDEEIVAEVLFLKCIEGDDDEEDVSVEIVEDDHEDFAMLMDLFKEDFKTLEIEIEE